MLRQQAAKLCFIASSADAPCSTTSAGANQFSIAMTARTTRLSTPMTTPPIPSAPIARSMCAIGSAPAPRRASSAHCRPPNTLPAVTATRPNVIAMFTTPMMSSGTKCAPWNPSNRCATRSGASRSIARQPSMSPPMNTGVSSDCPSEPTKGTRAMSRLSRM